LLELKYYNIQLCCHRKRFKGCCNLNNKPLFIMFLFHYWNIFHPAPK
jgi:hypothetical protein